LTVRRAEDEYQLPSRTSRRVPGRAAPSLAKARRCAACIAAVAAVRGGGGGGGVGGGDGASRCCLCFCCQSDKISNIVIQDGP